jgi:excisionase family DNA binding protein
MLLTIKDLSVWLNIKPSTLYLWAAQGKIPCQKIHGLIRFDPQAIQQWLETFNIETSHFPSLRAPTSDTDVDAVIARAKRSLYTAPCEKPDEDRAKQGG